MVCPMGALLPPAGSGDARFPAGGLRVLARRLSASAFGPFASVAVVAASFVDFVVAGCGWEASMSGSSFGGCCAGVDRGFADPTG